MTKEYAIWVDNGHSNFGKYPFTPERYADKKSAEDAFKQMFDENMVKLLQDAGLHFNIDEI